MVEIVGLIEIALTKIVYFAEDVGRVGHLTHAVLVEEKEHQETAAFGEVEFELHYGIGDVFAGQFVG